MTLLIDKPDTKWHLLNPLDRDPNARAAAADLLPAPRGWLLFTGGIRPGGADPVPEWILKWPCDLQLLAEVIGRIRDGEESQQELLRVHGDGGDRRTVTNPHSASFQPQLMVWLLDSASACELGWMPVRADALDPAEEERRVMASLELLFNATMSEVPGTTCSLSSDDVAIARRLAATLMKLERASETHGNCLTRMTRQVLHRWSLPIDRDAASPIEATP